MINQMKLEWIVVSHLKEVARILQVFFYIKTKLEIKKLTHFKNNEYNIGDYQKLNPKRSASYECNMHI